MTYKSILVHVDAAAQSARLRCAADLAGTFDATVIGLGAEAVAPLGVSAGGGYEAAEAAWIAARRDQIKENLIVAESRFRDAVSGRSQEWRTSLSAPTENMAQMARAADLIVVGGDDPMVNFDPYKAVDIGHLILTAGRPVLL
jgi:nucleotide-binding universal stress UspA family protein